MTGQVAPALRIVELRAENVKRLRAVHIAPDGHVVEIAGRNGQGKTSILDSISLALEGRNARPVEHPVRAGEESASVEVDVGELVVRRSWTRGGEGQALTVKARLPNGRLAVMNTPQAILDELVGHIAFDPLRFARLAPKARREELLRLVPVGIDLDDVEARRAATYEQRSHASRRVRDLEGEARSLPAVDGPEEQEVAVAELAAEMRRVAEENGETDRIAREVKRLDAEALALRARVERLRSELAEAEGLRAEADRALASAREALGGRQVLSVETVQRRMEAAEASNRAVRERNAARSRAADVRARLATEQQRHQALSQELEAIDTAKREALASAPMPIPGLSIGADDVTLNGVPFGDLSSSEQIRVGLALAMLGNPRLKVACIRDGSLLDVESRRKLAAWAEANDAQIWIEVVGDGGEGAVVIEDGSVVPAAAAVGGA